MIYSCKKSEFCKNKQYDIVINSAMPSRRFWALNNPVSDVMESVVKTAEIFYEWKYDKFIQISSISAQIQTDIPYGAHKKAAEVVVENNKDAMIVLASMALVQNLVNYK